MYTILYMYSKLKEELHPKFCLVKKEDDSWRIWPKMHRQ